MPSAVSTRVQKRRDALRASGMRPLQIWVPDTRRQGFAEECRRQAMVIAQAERIDSELDGILDAILGDLGSDES